MSYLNAVTLLCKQKINRFGFCVPEFSLENSALSQRDQSALAPKSRSSLSPATVGTKQKVFCFVFILPELCKSCDCRVTPGPVQSVTSIFCHPENLEKVLEMKAPEERGRIHSAKEDLNKYKGLKAVYRRALTVSF